MADLKWTNAAHPPPIKERLLLIVSAAGKPPDAQLMGTSEIVVGYWTGSTFRPMTVDHNDLGTAVDATHWATIGPALPKGICLRPQPIFGENVRE